MKIFSYKSLFLSFQVLSLFLLMLLATGCASPCYDYPCLGADEFVADSHLIRKGKLAILELEGKEINELPIDAMCEYRDTISEDDVLNIAIYHPTRKDLMESILFINNTVGGFRVYNGMIDIPDISYVEVEGLSLEEARKTIQEKFNEHISNIEVFITYRDRLTKKVELAGLVGVPSVPVDGKIRLYEVLSRAHIPAGANLFKSYIIRNGCPLPIDLYKLMIEGDMCQNIVMRGKDKIYIASPSDSTVILMGELRNPRPVNLPYGFISLREALVSAGGIPYTGDRKHIQVIRGNLKSPKIYILSWEHIIHLPNDSLLLMPGDTVYVSEKPITQWNRFIEQLLPSCQGISTGYGIYQIFNN